jgi:dTMP kinase
MTLFITFEGGEGCGKSLQSRALCRKLNHLAIPAILVHEPGGTTIGEKVRRLLKRAREIQISPLTELLLFNASRSQLVKDVIHPALVEGKIVICDRFSDSTLAYQSYGRGLNFSFVEEINRIASQGVRPDITFLLDIPPGIGLSRKRANVQDRFELEAIDFHQKVREGFLKLAAREPGRWIVIDASSSKAKISRLIWDKVKPLLEKRNLITSSILKSAK